MTGNSEASSRPNRVLMVHNYYQQRGGEDSVFETEFRLLKENGHAVEKLQFHNMAIQSWAEKLKTGVNLFYNKNSAAKLQNMINTFHPDIIHVHNFFPLASPSIFTQAYRAKIPIVMTLHNFRLICANALLFRENSICEKCLTQSIPLSGIRHACYRGSATESAALTMMTLGHRWLKTWRGKVNRYITLTEFSKKKFLSSPLGLMEDQIVVKPNCLEDYGEGAVTDREDYFLFIGRLTDEKGIEPLLEAFKRSGLQLKIIGIGPREEFVRETSNRYTNIEYLGFLQNENIIAILKRARALVFPSCWYEGFPVTILEALSTGTPVLASAIGGLPEIVQDKFNGLHLVPGSIQSIQDQTNLISREETLHESLCLNARASYLSRYTPEINYQILQDIYCKIIRNQHADAKNY